MQSPQFDGSAYQGQIYEPPPGFESGAIKIHNPGYVGENDPSCYANYITPGVHAAQGYGCRDPSAYVDISTLFPPPGVMSNFGSANYYKVPARQMDVADYTSSGVTRQQDNFLMKPFDPALMAGSPSAVYISNNPNMHEDHSFLHHHQQMHHHNHHQHHGSYGVAPQNAGSPKFPQDNVLYNNPGKIELETGHSRGNFDTLSSSTTVSGSVNSGPGQQDIPSSSQVMTASCDQIRPQPSPGMTDVKPTQPASPHASLTITTTSTTSSTSEKKDVETLLEPKPTMSYIALIAKAILESEERRLNLGSIYNWIEKHYPFYKNKGQGWRNSVRHNLSLNDCFIKAGRCEDGKGNYWAIHPANIQDFLRGDFRQRRRSRRRGRKKECDLSMYQVPNGYLPPPSSSLTSAMTFTPSALSSIYSPYTEAERRAYRLDEALLRQSISSPFVKWYQQGVTTSGYGVPTTPPAACSTGSYPSSAPVQWSQTYSDTNNQTMYPTFNSTFPR